MKSHEQAHIRDMKAGQALGFKHKKESEAPVCAKCKSPMEANKRPTGIKFICSEKYCYHSYFETNES